VEASGGLVVQPEHAEPDHDEDDGETEECDGHHDLSSERFSLNANLAARKN
jgi:hypothetical protein